MKYKSQISVCLFLITLLSTCKKYPEGGFVNQTRKHLFGGNHVGDSKTWKLKLYEVNGIDSTYLIQGANSIPDFYEKFVTFTYEGKETSVKYSAKTFTNKYTGSIGTVYKEIGINYDWTNHEDSSQCKLINNTIYCERNILFPEFLDRNATWSIEKLTKKELIITENRKNAYRIILAHE